MSPLSTINKEIKEILEELNNFVTRGNFFEQINRNNNYNKIFSILLNAYKDLDSFVKRLNEEIKSLIDIEYVIQRRSKNEDLRVINKEGQGLRNLSSELTKSTEADFKALHVFLKIFLDKYIQLLCFIKPIRALKHGSITKFNESIKKIPSGNNFVDGFKKSCSLELDAIDKKLTFYRDKFIVHSTPNQNFTVWFISDMKGNVKFCHVDGTKGEEISSLSPNKLLEVSKEFIARSTLYFIKSLSS